MPNQDRPERKRAQAQSWRDLGNQQTMSGNDSAADAAYALADQRDRESLWSTHWL